MSSSKPAVSVILASYQGEQRVAGAIESVLDQSFSDFELLTIDDGSRDGTSEVIRSFAAADARVVPLRLDVNGGLYVARSTAIARARAELLAFIDDDDRWLPDKLARQLAILGERPNTALLHGAVIDVFSNGSRRLRRPHRRANSYRELLCQDRIATSSVILRRRAYEAAGSYDTSFRAFGDWDMWTRIARDFSIASDDAPVAIINIRLNSIQRGSIENFERYRSMAIEKRRPELRRYGLERRTSSLHHYAVAAKLHFFGQSREARARAWQSLILRPNLEALALLGLTALPAPLADEAQHRLRKFRGLLRI